MTAIKPTRTRIMLVGILTGMLLTLAAEYVRFQVERIDRMELFLSQTFNGR